MRKANARLSRTRDTRDEKADLMEYVREQRVKMAKMCMGKHVWLLKRWMLQAMVDTSGETSLYTLSNEQKLQLMQHFNLTGDQFDNIKDATAALSRERMGPAHRDHCEDLPSHKFKQYLDLIAQDSAMAATEQRGLLMREWLNKMVLEH